MLCPLVTTERIMIEMSNEASNCRDADGEYQKSDTILVGKNPRV